MPGTLSLTDLATHFFENERRVGIVIDLDQVTACAVAATRFYAAYGNIRSLSPDRDPLGANDQTYADARLSPIVPVAIDQIDEDVELTAGEWGVIRPLFALYVERENAIHLESSRSFGLDPFGRSSSEVLTEIKMTEDELPRKAFRQPVISV